MKCGFWLDMWMVSESSWSSVLGDHAARLHRHRRQPLLQDALLDHHVRRVEGRLDPVFGRVGEVPGQVVGEVRVGLGAGRFEGREHVHDRRQRLVVDLDGVRRVARLLDVFGNHDRHRLALEDAPRARRSGTDPARCASRPRRRARPGASPAVSTFLKSAGREHGLHAGHAAGVAAVDRDDAGMGVRAAHDHE